MLYMAGFEVTLHGRFWVSPEELAIRFSDTERQRSF
jgi:hypothetical protein